MGDCSISSMTQRLACGRHKLAISSWVPLDAKDSGVAIVVVVEFPLIALFGWQTLPEWAITSPAIRVSRKASPRTPQLNRRTFCHQGSKAKGSNSSSVRP